MAAARTAMLTSERILAGEVMRIENCGGLCWQLLWKVLMTVTRQYHDSSNSSSTRALYVLLIISLELTIGLQCPSPLRLESVGKSPPVAKVLDKLERDSTHVAPGGMYDIACVSLPLLSRRTMSFRLWQVAGRSAKSSPHGSCCRPPRVDRQRSATEPSLGGREGLLIGPLQGTPEKSEFRLALLALSALHCTCGLGKSIRGTTLRRNSRSDYIALLMRAQSGVSRALCIVRN